MPLPVHFFELLVFISLGLIAFRALGLVIASVANTMQEGTILVQLFYFPMLLLSGATFPSEKFPRVMQIIHNFVPATYLVQGMKNIMLKGQSLTEKENLLAVFVMLLTIVGGGLISMKLFRWEKEEKIRGSAKLWVLGRAGAILCDGHLEVVSHLRFREPWQHDPVSIAVNAELLEKKPSAGPDHPDYRGCACGAASTTARD